MKFRVHAIEEQPIVTISVPNDEDWDGDKYTMSAKRIGNVIALSREYNTYEGRKDWKEYVYTLHTDELESIIKTMNFEDLDGLFCDLRDRSVSEMWNIELK
jgi:hypothetical protein